MTDLKIVFALMCTKDEKNITCSTIVLKKKQTNSLLLVFINDRFYPPSFIIFTLFLELGNSITRFRIFISR